MCFAYYKAEIDRCLFVVFPLNLIMAALWWLQDKWARHAHADSWIENEVTRRVTEKDTILRRK